SYARLSNCDISNADLTGATLDSAFFDGATMSGAQLGGASASGAQFGGLSPAFSLDPSQEGAVRSGSAGALVGLFQQKGYTVSASAVLTQLSGLWIVKDGTHSYSVLLVNVSDT